MPMTPTRDVFITCAITGSGGTQDRSPHVPRSPEEIANSAIAAARAGAAIVHCHVRDPETGVPSRDPKLYREVTDRIRAADIDMVAMQHQIRNVDIQFIIDCANFDTAVRVLHQRLIEDVVDQGEGLQAA